MTGLEFAPQQVKVLHLAAQGMGQREIARRLNIKLPTVRSHLMRIYDKLGMSGHLRGAKLGPKLTAWAIQHGYGQEMSNA